MAVGGFPLAFWVQVKTVFGDLKQEEVVKKTQRPTGKFLFKRRLLNFNNLALDRFPCLRSLLWR